MLLRIVPLLSVIFLAACSSSAVKHTETEKNAQPVVKYAQNNSKIMPVNALVSSNNLCVDRFNFLRQAGNDKYQKFSRDYIQINDGYRFLNTNKNIMNGDAKRVLTHTLDMKLDTLCSEVNFAGFQVIRQKISALSDI
ncbi:hypothetical protein [Yersinia pekkanenii]|uniref:Lipoprotein n=1 Tax=Yersinia pekkanenii TaxID=1288385 RepID=A0A0T9RFR5_9GAMM|nr:hypothetical protein [Yersinia pekkanenii]CNI60562.1 Uncharacterised protein [Yersinia pekkanenii]CRY69570.1 Uncharacterised protein [Yersinia pekkanenii]